MNINKAEMKISLTKEFGKQFGDKKKDAEKEQWAYIGEVRGIRNAAKKVADLMTHVDQDLKEGKLDGLLNEPLLIAKYAKKQYQHAVGVMDNLATQSEISAHRAAGVEIGYRRAADMIQKAYDEEVRKLESLRQAIDQGKVRLVEGELVYSDEEGPRQGPGGHPGPPMKARRLAEDAAEAAADAKAEDKPKGRKKATVGKGKAKSKLTLVKEGKEKDSTDSLPKTPENTKSETTNKTVN